MEYCTQSEKKREVTNASYVDTNLNLEPVNAAKSLIPDGLSFSKPSSVPGCRMTSNYVKKITY